MPVQGDIRVEDYALDFLSHYYARHKKSSGLLVNRLVLTKEGAQADGLLTYRREDGTCFAASLSVRQSDKLSAILSQYKRKGLGNARFLTAACLFAGTSLAGLAAGNWLVLWALPVCMAVAGFYLHSRIRRHVLHQQLSVAVEEIKQLPADEQWMGVRVSSLCWRNNAMATKLAEICRRRGVGLLTVGKRARLTLRQEPRTATCRRADYLCYYATEASLRTELADQFMRVA